MQGCHFCQTKEQDFEGISQWPDGDIPWTITALIPGLTLDQMKADIAWGYDLWARHFGIRPRYTADAREARILIGTRRIDGPSGVLAEAELPGRGARQTRMWFDSGDQWTSEFDDNTRRIVAKLVGCHEGGHSLGISHAPTKDNIMYASYNSAQRTAGQWEVKQGIARYGTPVVIVPPASPPTGGGGMDEAAVMKAQIQNVLRIVGVVARMTTPTWDDSAVAFLSQDFVVNLMVMLFTKFGNGLATASPKAIEDAIAEHLKMV
jgi:hypothetical protein